MSDDDAIKVVRADSGPLLRAVERLRYRAYVEKQGISIPWADYEKRELRDSYDPIATSFALLDGETVVGSLRLADLERVPDKPSVLEKFSLAEAVAFFGERPICLSSRFIVDEGRLSIKRAMVDLMGAGYRYLVENRHRVVLGDCSPELSAFYYKIGYRLYAKPFVDPVFGTKVPLMLIVGDLEWLESVRSPLLPFTGDVATDAEASKWFSTTYGPCGIESFGRHRRNSASTIG